MTPATVGTRAGDPGTGCCGAGRTEGIRRSHALCKFPGAQPVRRFLGWDLKRRTPRAGASGRVRAERAGTPPQSPRPATPSPRPQGKGKVGDPGTPRGPGPRVARGREKPARCTHCLALAAGREGAHLRSPPGAGAGRGAGRRRAVPRGRRARMHSPRRCRSTSRLLSSTGSAPASQAAAASIALPAAASARHCAPGPARRGHMLRPRLGRSDPRRGPAWLRAWTAGPCCGARGAPSSLSRPPGKTGAGRLPSRGSGGGAQKPEPGTGKGVGLVSALPTTAGMSRPNPWRRRLLW